MEQVNDLFLSRWGISFNVIAQFFSFYVHKYRVLFTSPLKSFQFSLPRKNSHSPCTLSHAPPMSTAQIPPPCHPTIRRIFRWPRCHPLIYLIMRPVVLMRSTRWWFIATAAARPVAAVAIAPPATGRRAKYSGVSAVTHFRRITTVFSLFSCHQMITLWRWTPVQLEGCLAPVTCM